MKAFHRGGGGLSRVEVLIAVMLAGIVAAVGTALLGGWSEEAEFGRFVANAIGVERAAQRYGTEHEAPWGFVYDPSDPGLLRPVAEGDTAYLAAQLEGRTDAYGNVAGAPAGGAGGATGEARLGPYTLQAFVPVPASLLLAAGEPKGPAGPMTLRGAHNPTREDLARSSPFVYFRTVEIRRTLDLDRALGVLSVGGRTFSVTPEGSAATAAAAASAQAPLAGTGDVSWRALAAQALPRHGQLGDPREIVSAAYALVEADRAGGASPTPAQTAAGARGASRVRELTPTLLSEIRLDTASGRVSRATGFSHLVLTIERLAP